MGSMRSRGLIIQTLPTAQGKARSDGGISISFVLEMRELIIESTSSKGGAWTTGGSGPAGDDMIATLNHGRASRAKGLEVQPRP